QAARDTAKETEAAKAAERARVAAEAEVSRAKADAEAARRDAEAARAEAARAKAAAARATPAPQRAPSEVHGTRARVDDLAFRGHEGSGQIDIFVTGDVAVSEGAITRTHA